MIDNIVQGKTRTRREFCSYYTHSDPILSCMISRLDVKRDDLILEPCAGDGIFVEKIVEKFPNQDFNIEALDMNPEAVCNLRNRFRHTNIRIRQCDTLLDPLLNSCTKMFGRYNKIIGNPPYGAWQDYRKREALKRLYGNYVRETYTLFIQRGIDLLKENGDLVYIVPDTFLALHSHKSTREKILKNTRINEIILIPSNFFPGINFGYSNLCIISLTKTQDIKNHKIKIVYVQNKIECLYKIADLKYSSADDFEEIDQESILNSFNYSFFLGGNSKVRKLLNCRHTVSLGDLAYCVTGFCSGDNKEFYRPLSFEQKGSKGYKLVNRKSIYSEYLKQPDILNGIRGCKQYIPILKGGGKGFKRQSDWFVKWDRKTVALYKSNKRSRFQNSQYYFKEGIGVPMVRGGKLKAFLLRKRMFDQSIVGVFPKNKQFLLYLLAFLNSETCNTILQSINHTTNNSANYLKRLPVVISNDYLDEVNSLVDDIVKNSGRENSLKKIDEIFNSLYDID